MLVTILGGARSGKSTFAEACARQYQRVIYFATARIPDGDAEMKERIGLHTARRPAGWMTLEPPATLDDLVRECQRIQPEAVIFDCVTLWLGWELSRTFNQYSRQQLQQHFDGEIGHLVNSLTSLPCPVFAVSNETGCGIVPEHRSGRLFRDLQGIANSRLMAASRLGFLCFAGKALLVHDDNAQTDFLPVATVSPAWVHGALSAPR